MALRRNTEMPHVARPARPRGGNRRAVSAECRRADQIVRAVEADLPEVIKQAPVLLRPRCLFDSCLMPFMKLSGAVRIGYRLRPVDRVGFDELDKQFDKSHLGERDGELPALIEPSAPPRRCLIVWRRSRAFSAIAVIVTVGNPANPVMDPVMATRRGVAPRSNSYCSPSLITRPPSGLHNALYEARRNSLSVSKSRTTAHKSRACSRDSAYSLA